MKLTKLPFETIDACPPVESLMPCVVELRNAALNANRFDYAIILSHTHAYLHWLKENWDELKEGTKC